jgi:hypothetical protein
MKELKKVTISRNSGNTKQSLGILQTDGFECKTLELADMNNKPRISCIPADTYIVKWTKSSLFSSVAGKDVFTYEVQKVPKRGGIRMHSANFFKQLLGCIALGSSLKDINLDSELDLIHSGDTMRSFEKHMNYEDFELTIIKNY